MSEGQSLNFRDIVERLLDILSDKEFIKSLLIISDRLKEVSRYILSTYKMSGKLEEYLKFVHHQLNFALDKLLKLVTIFCVLLRFFNLRPVLELYIYDNAHDRYVKQRVCVVDCSCESDGSACFFEVISSSSGVKYRVVLSADSDVDVESTLLNLPLIIDFLLREVDGVDQSSQSDSEDLINSSVLLKM